MSTQVKGRQVKDGSIQRVDLSSEVGVFYNVRVATTVAGTLATSFENGDVVDGITLVTGDKILIKDQSAGAENGVRVVAASGAPTRATDYNTDAKIRPSSIQVKEGTANGSKIFKCTNTTTITVDTTAIVYAEVGGSSGGGSLYFDDDGSTPSVAPSAAGSDAIAIGDGASAAGANSFAQGTNSNAASTEAIAIGRESDAITSTYSIAIGSFSLSSGISSIAIGGSTATSTAANATSNYAIAIGQGTDATNTRAIAIGFGAQATAADAIVIRGSASGTHGIAIRGSAGGSNAISLGNNSSASQTYAIAIGFASSATAQNSIAIGRSAGAPATLSIAIGRSTQTSAYSVSIGYNADSGNGGNSHVAIGRGALSRGTGSIAIGYGANIASNTGLAGIHIGRDARSIMSPGNNSFQRTIVIGDSARATNYTAGGSNIMSSGVAIGTYARISANYSTSIGLGAQVNHQSSSGLALGNDCRVGTTGFTNINGIAIGRSAFAYNSAASLESTIALGSYARGRINRTIQVQATSILRKDDFSAADSTDELFQWGAGNETVLMTKEIDLAATSTLTINVPAGSRFFPNEVGIIYSSGTLTTNPEISFGISGNNTKLLASTLTTLASQYDRNNYTSLSKNGESTLTATVAVAGSGTALRGRFFFKGILVENE